jgi:hypothetical protein
MSYVKIQKFKNAVASTISYNNININININIKT